MSSTAPLRLAAWNCRQGLDGKRYALELLGADVVVLPECNSTPAVARELDVSFRWRGDHDAKGLGIVGFHGWTVDPLDAPVELPWVLPARIRDASGAHAFDLLAVWTVARRDGRPGYAGQIARVLDEWGPTLTDGNTIVAGDFNCSLQGLSPNAHRRNLERLARLGMCSSYHALAVEEHGLERAMTLQWAASGGIRRGYHCDFVFVPERLLPRVTAVGVGHPEEWIESGLSDHCPLTVDFG